MTHLAGTGADHVRRLLTQGELTVRGQIRGASNAVLHGVVGEGPEALPCVYKPVAGERPLWDFPDGTLAQREVAAYQVARAMGWDELVPVTVLRDGPYGEGMCQLWVGPVPRTGADEPGEPAEPGEPESTVGEGDPASDAGDSLLALVETDEPGPGWKAVGFAEVGEGRTALLVHADDPRLRRLAVLDAVVNNGDRKGGHLLTSREGRLYAIDHGVTFHVEDRLRTLLWGWAGEPLTTEGLEVLRRLSGQLADGAELAGRLAELITEAEVDAVRKRVGDLLATGRHPLPSGRWPAIPWPPV
ncbi:phosphatidylinositol kinase [Streptomyces oceani]|uniref:Phosphatidylinositol kinase n=2 Tax=Streptomyces oceani TaxID=1075402 RepID=A0A1E7KH49_9ACTN|nr:SCO1664 family protein [Streptomyces oceani]OEV03259.1 phosphatidylinositol kinase [Streptomyces oceani]